MKLSLLTRIILPCHNELQGEMSLSSKLQGREVELGLPIIELLERSPTRIIRRTP